MVRNHGITITPITPIYFGQSRNQHFKQNQSQNRYNSHLFANIIILIYAFYHALSSVGLPHSPYAIGRSVFLIIPFSPLLTSSHNPHHLTRP
jgi:hypothetical protein